MLIPFAIVIALMAVFMIVPEKSKSVVDTMRGFFGDTIGIYYPILAISSVVCALYVAMNSKYGNIKLGNVDKPAYSNFKWGTMIFTSTMAHYVLLAYRMGSLWSRISFKRNGFYDYVGSNIHLIPLGTIGLGILCYTCCMFRFHDARS